jgi:hypothetical protein
MDSPVKRRITAAERVAAYPARSPHSHVPSAMARNRKYLLLPVVPVATLLGIGLLIGLLETLPRSAAIPALLATWIASIVDAARRSRPAWVVAVVLFWPSLVAYWTVRAFRLGHR